ncbi:MAG: acyl-CoA dehydrogenase family protein, partial [Ilumatobacteraceae bacterium]
MTELIDRSISFWTMSMPTIFEFRERAQQWLEDHAPPRKDQTNDSQGAWGEGRFNVAVFHSLSFDEEHDLVEQLKRWTMLKASQGYHAITAPRRYGGLGLGREYAREFVRLEANFDTPTSHELHSVTTRLVAPTIQVHGSEAQQVSLVGRFLAARELCCQLFSEPNAGSDLASLAWRAVRDGDDWIVNGQKVWSSGAQFAEFGELIARHDADVAKHKGLTAFVIPLDLPGIEVRPIKQISGGSSFNEVFLNDVRVPDSMRLGEVGEGWKVALTTLGFERDHSDSGASRVGGSWSQLLGTARMMGATVDPVTRQQLMRVYTHHRLEGFVNRRAADLRRSGAPAGPEGSLGKLLWTEGMNLMSDVVSGLLGPHLVADAGEWGTYEWGEHVLGAPGYRIAG